jgi:hypothetical protein
LPNERQDRKQKALNATTTRSHSTCDWAAQIAPQNPVQDTTRSQKFTDCANGAGLGNLLGITNFADAATDLISRISVAEGTAVELLAYTWWKESSFNMYEVPNTFTDPKDPAH